MLEARSSLAAVGDPGYEQGCGPRGSACSPCLPEQAVRCMKKRTGTRRREDPPIIFPTRALPGHHLQVTHRASHRRQSPDGWRPWGTSARAAYSSAVTLLIRKAERDRKSRISKDHPFNQPFKQLSRGASFCQLRGGGLRLEALANEQEGGRNTMWPLPLLHRAGRRRRTKSRQHCNTKLCRRRSLDGSAVLTDRATSSRERVMDGAQAPSGSLGPPRPALDLRAIMKLDACQGNDGREKGVTKHCTLLIPRPLCLKKTQRRKER